MKYYSTVERELISIFIVRLREEFYKRYKGKVHFNLYSDSENEKDFICNVTFIKNEFTLYCTQFEVAWVDFSRGIDYELIVKKCCNDFRKWIYDKYFF